MFRLISVAMFVCVIVCVCHCKRVHKRLYSIIKSIKCCLFSYYKYLSFSSLLLCGFVILFCFVLQSNIEADLIASASASASATAVTAVTAAAT